MDRSRKVPEYINTDLMPTYMFLCQYCLHSRAVGLTGMGSLSWASQNGYCPQFYCQESVLFWQGNASHVEHVLNPCTLQCQKLTQCCKFEKRRICFVFFSTVPFPGGGGEWAVMPSGVSVQPAWLQVSSWGYLLWGETFISCYAWRVNSSEVPNYLSPCLHRSRHFTVWLFTPTGLVQVGLTILLAVFNLHRAIRLALGSNWITGVFELVDEINNLIP